MFPHNSSSHEISTETNAFVQNSKGDVVVLEGSSLSGVGEGNGPENTGYCDIEFINSSSTMAAPTSHPEATAANDFSTVLSRHSGELGSAGVDSSRRSAPAPASAATAASAPASSATTIATIPLPPSQSSSAAARASRVVDVASTSHYDGSSNNNVNNNKNNNNNPAKKSSNNKNGCDYVLPSGAAVAAAAAVEAAVVAAGAECQSSNTSNNHNNAEHNHHKRRMLIIVTSEAPRSRPNEDDDEGELDVSGNANNYYQQQQQHSERQRQRLRQRQPRPASQAANSKSTSKPLSDNKDSFSSVSPRVLSLRLRRHQKRRGGSSSISGNKRDAANKCRKTTKRGMDNKRINKNNRSSLTGPTPSLVRIPKSDGQRALNLKAKISHVSYFKPNNSKSVISLSSSSSRVASAMRPMPIRRRQHQQHRTNISNNNNNYKSSNNNNNYDEYDKDGAEVSARTASSSITLTVSKRREPLAFATEPVISYHQHQLSLVDIANAATELKRRLISALCVPLTIGTPPTIGVVTMKTTIIIIIKMPVTSSRRIIDGISCTEATICTVGALSFQDNNKSNEPLNISFKSVAPLAAAVVENEDEKVDYVEEKAAAAAMDRESNLKLKSLSKSTPSVKSSDKSDTDVVLIINDNDNDNVGEATSHGDELLLIPRSVEEEEEKKEKKEKEEEEKNSSQEDEEGEDVGRQIMIEEVRPTVNIPIVTTCEPTMTLTCQSTTVTSQANDVPAEPRHDARQHLQGIDCHEDEKKKITSNKEEARKSETRASLVEDCKDLLADYRITRDPRYLTRLREALNTLLTTRDYSNAIIDTKSTTPSTSTSLLSSSTATLPARLRPLMSCSKAAAATIASDMFGYKQRWGIPAVLGLAGGGESSLSNNSTANWASAQPTTPNNNNQAQSGWGGGGGGGGTPGNQSVVGGQTGPTNNWQSVSVPRTIGNQLNNQNPNQNQNQGPQVGPNNQGSNAQSGPTTPQSNNQAQSNQGNVTGGNNAGQWSQSSGKSSNPGGPNNPQAQNNNSGNVPGQQQQQQPQQAQQQPGQPQQQQQPPVGGAGNNNQQLANAVPGTVSAATTPTTNNPSTKQQLEQLNTMREALFSPDGWGCQNVNQDSNWDVPSSPEPSMNKDSVPLWKPTINNGTDLWEANLRNGGQPPPQQQAKTPWGHTPSTNIGGTWGEDDDTADSSNMWTGAPAPSQPNTQWPGGSGNQSNMCGGGGGAVAGCSSWGDPRVDPRDPREIRSVDPREMRGGDPRDHRMSVEPRELRVRLIDPMARDPRMSGEMRGDPRGGISGRLNGASADAMWNLPPGPPHHQIPSHQHPSGPPAKMLAPSSMNQWSAQQPKDMMPGKPSGWEEPSPPTQRRNMPNYDDGTSLWANPAANQRPMQSSKVSHWKDGPAQNLGRGGMQCPPGMLQNQMPGQPGMKPESMGGGGGGGGGGPTWATHPGSGGPTGGGHNGSWTDAPPDTPGWGETKSRNRRYQGVGEIVEKSQPMGPSGAGNWADTEMDPTSSWGHSAKPVLSKELIWNSREFRYLCDLGFKKEDVELALRNREMNREEAQELLYQLRPVDQWRRHDRDAGHSGYDPTSQSAGAQSFPRFNHVSQQMSFPPGVGVPSGAVAAAGGSVASASLLKLQQQQQQQQQQAAAVQLQQQQQQPSSNAPQPPINQASRTPQGHPSTQQLRMLVQQIQLAVQEGYLNHQILNQPLAPQTLILLNQLLQQIKVLQQLHQQHTMQNSLKGNGQTLLQISVQITKTKQQIANLQNQIAVQQATYMKQQQQQQQQQHPTTPSQPPDYYKASVHDPMSALQNSFSDLAMNKEPPVSQQQSRLNQWKLPSLDKDGDSVANEFSRAPGSTSSKPPTTPGGLSQSHSSPNMNPLLGPGDGTWSTRLGDSGWPDAGNSDSTDGKDWQPQAAGAAFTDLVPEFEPGKPWKMKTIEDDPSITPGSVVRSPLSLAAIKDTDTIFSAGSKTSPPPQSANADSTSIPSLSNSTWSFNPPATTPSVFVSSKNTWGDAAPPPTAVTSELWGAPMSKRGPPPGLSSKGTGSVSNASNGWAALGRSNTWGLQSNAAGAGAGNTGWVSPSTWLLLRNLTPQIDGSTLKTLCMQHGPVQDFRLYLNYGIALAKYSSRDEAIKAQGALNNCVLGNTTIFAESPGDSEVHTLLQQLSHGSGGGGSAAGAGAQQPSSGAAGWGLRAAANKAPPPTDTWGAGASQLWGAPPVTNSLWSNAGIDTSDQQRATPSSLNSYLPGDLLGGESM